MALYTKIRPQSFDEVLGNKELKDSLQTMLKKREHPHTYLLQGGTGCGKTTIARIMAKTLNIHDNDVKEMDIADLRGIDNAREVRREASYAPMYGNRKMYILDEAHKLTTDAQNAFLKILEDTPEHVYFVLCTTDPQKLIKTVINRCTVFTVENLSPSEMTKLVKRTAKEERQRVDKEVVEHIVEKADGHPRHALTMLETILNTSPENRLCVIQEMKAYEAQGIELARALVKKQSWATVNKILKGLDKKETETYRHQVLGYCSAILLSKPNDQAAAVMEEMLEPFYNSGFAGLVYACYAIIN